MSTDEDIKKLWEEFILKENVEDCDPEKTYKSANMSIESIFPKSSPDTIVSSYHVDSDPLANSQQWGACLTDSENYEFLDEIARGGMGIVYKGKQLNLQREIAIKKIKDNNSVGNKGKFVCESLVTAYLDHPNIVPVYDLKENSEEEVFLAMKLVRGTEWKNILDPKTTEDKILAQKYNTESHLRILLNVCNALSYAHSKNVIHNDLKPSNVMVGEFGEILVMDWGIAVDISEGVSFSKGLHKSMVNNPMGTPSYMPWELAQGCGDNIGVWTDVYLLGGVLYHILMGRPPHGGGIVSALFAAVTGKLPPFSIDIPKELQQICHKAMSKDIEKRYENIAQFQQCIENYLQHKESIVISEKAQAIIDKKISSEQNKSYAQFSEAIAGFTQALQLWAENKQAKVGLEKARIAYATTALQHEDFGLADAQLDFVAQQKAQQLKMQINHARNLKLRMQRTSKYMRYLLYIATTVIIAGLTIGFLLIRKAERNTKYRENKALQQLAQIALSKSKEAYQLASSEITKKGDYPHLQKIENYYDKCGVYAEKSLEFSKKIQFISSKNNIQIDKLKKLAQGMIDISSKRPFSPLLWKIKAANSGKINAVHFNADAELFATAGNDKIVYLWNTVTGTQVTSFSGHQSTINTVRFSPNGRYLSSGSTDKTIRVWDIKTGKQIFTFRGHSGSVNNICFFKEILASASSDKTIRLWNIITGKQITVLKGHLGSVKSIDFSSDGTSLVSGSADKTIRLWDIITKKNTLVFRGHSKAVNAVKFAQNYILSGSTDKTIRLWNSNTGKQLKIIANSKSSVLTLDYDKNNKVFVYNNGIKLDICNINTAIHAFHGHLGQINFAHFSRDGKYLLSCSKDRTVKLWNMAKRKQISIYNNHIADIYSIIFSNDGKYLLSCSKDKTIRMWDAQNGRQIHCFTGHTSAVTSAVFSHDGKYIVSCSKDKSIKVWSVQQRKQLLMHSFSTFVHSAKFSSDDKYLFFILGNNTVKILNIQTGNYSTFIKHKTTLNEIKISAQGQHLMAICHDNSIRVWNTKTKQQIAKLPHPRQISSATFSTNINYIVSGCTDKVIRLWDIKTGKEIHSFRGHSSQVNSVDLSHDNRFIVSSSYDKTIRIWHVKTQALAATLQQSTSTQSCHFDVASQKVVFISDNNRTVQLWDVSLITNQPLLNAKSVSFVNDKTFASSHKNTIKLWSLENKQITKSIINNSYINSIDLNKSKVVCGGKDGTINKWNIDNSKIIATMKGHKAPIWCVKFSKDGKYIASGGEDNLVYLWNAKNAKQQAVFKGHSNTVTAVDFSRNKRYLASSSKDKTVILWDIVNKKRLAVFSESKSEIYAVSFAPDNQHLAIGANNRIYIWNIHNNHISTIIFDKPDIRYCTYSGDGKYIICNFSAGIKIWDITTSQELPIARHHNMQILRYNGNDLICSTFDGFTYLWEPFQKYNILQSHPQTNHLHNYKVKEDMSVVRYTTRNLWQRLSSN
ncbi:WD40 repeat domain-containing serine/threonine-protein kinase [Candidatus Uabimicrobium sp. HlEnr_7]|uniref:WD40 repeat domain-containing serine/threonine-protein kinase n=1 Tax=Candidatus Uabimicrobium helgolandensis TaxID=3095367 RepID=UPI0035578513